MKNIFYLLSIIGLLSSCDIERFPYDSVETEELLASEGGLESATLGNYAILKGDANGNGFAQQLHRLSEYPGDNVSLSGTTTDPLFYTYNYNNIATNSRTNNFWISSYRAIVGANKVIELAEEGRSPERDQLIGENYYLRALTYFQLANIFGRPYSHGTSNLGVPLKLTSDINDLPDRNTVGEVYSQVVSDLQKAESLMNEPRENPYASKAAAQALLSRVYLYMGENQKAIEYADKVINSGRFSLLSSSQLPDYFQMSPEDNPETIFAFRFLEESDYNHGWYTVGSLYASIEGTGWGEMYASRSFLDLINRHPEDVRKSFIDPQYIMDENGNKVPAVFWIDENFKYQFRVISERGDKLYITHNETEKEIIQDQDGNYYFNDSAGNRIDVTKDYDVYKRNGYPRYYILKTSLQEGVPHLWSPVVSRLGELYLNKAEAYAKLGNTELALENVNVIRERAGIPIYESPADFPEGSDILDIALTERRLELAFEGHRKFDVFRNNRTMNREYPGTHLLGNNPWEVIPPSSDRIIEYIPESQINVQPSLQQNP
ncbi:RagB/SusD family nutrient uptake outer membrane protein [Gramella jeungdoensis]|uniref:RagB/SusD family nutrient uptake outer membrane protein n=1 Tax=Gramella jeungdoensis TaxID=708091 RepID=A0ABT0Z5C5_9FLAO|nr:RagB/SusD family nutrient uptake outer membrane protein [Gramella jeungdoensis]MCM8570357.1 RagB/SusD family nutrient uptake outer membrane protein [Gramella jeungdoensis]